MILLKNIRIAGMERREFLRKGLTLGTAGLLPGIGLKASDCLSIVPGIPSESIWDAAVHGRWGAVKHWLRCDPTLINITGRVSIQGLDCDKVPLFHLVSALNPSVGFLKSLVAIGANSNASNEYGNTPLEYAVFSNSNVAVLEYLISRGANINAVNENGGLLHYARRNPNVQVFEYLVSQGVDVYATDKWDNTPLHWAAKENPNVEVLKYLVSQGLDVNAKNGDGNTALHLAMRSGQSEVAEYLISCGTDETISLRAHFKKTILKHAG